MEDLSSSTSFRIVIMIVGPAPGCSISRGDNIWRSCVVRVLIYVLQKKKTQKNQFLHPVVCTMVLQIMVWFWIHFEQIFHTSPAACKRRIGSHTLICFSPPITIALFSPLTQSMPVGMLQRSIPTFPFHGSTYIHAPTTVSPGGHRSSVGGEHRCYPILEPHPHPFPHSPPIIFVHPNPPIPSHPAPAGHTAVGQWYLLLLTSKLTVQSCSATMRGENRNCSKMMT